MTGAEEAKRATIAIVDDDKVLCDLLEKRLEAESDLCCGGIALQPSEARKLAGDLRPDVILLDGVNFHNHWPDERRIDPIDLAVELVGLSPSSHLLLWTGWADPSPRRERELNLRVRARRAGAEDFVLKGDGLDVLLKKVREALDRKVPNREIDESAEDPMMEKIMQLMGSDSEVVRTEPDDVLTPAQVKWAGVLARGWEAGMTVPEIGSVYHVAEATLRKHAQDIRNAWDVHNLAQFVAEARRRGLA